MTTTRKTSRNKGLNEPWSTQRLNSNFHLSLCFSMFCEWPTFPASKNIEKQASTTKTCNFTKRYVSRCFVSSRAFRPTFYDVWRVDPCKPTYPPKVPQMSPQAPKVAPKASKMIPKAPKIIPALPQLGKLGRIWPQRVHLKT